MSSNHAGAFIIFNLSRLLTRNLKKIIWSTIVKFENSKPLKVFDYNALLSTLKSTGVP